MDCCKTKDNEGCCKDIGKKTFFRSKKQKSQKLNGGNKKWILE